MAHRRNDFAKLRNIALNKKEISASLRNRSSMPHICKTHERPNFDSRYDRKRF